MPEAHGLEEWDEVPQLRGSHGRLPVILQDGFQPFILCPHWPQDVMDAEKSVVTLGDHSWMGNPVLEQAKSPRIQGGNGGKRGQRLKRRCVLQPVAQLVAGSTGEREHEKAWTCTGFSFADCPAAVREGVGLATAGRSEKPNGAFRQGTKFFCPVASSISGVAILCSCCDRSLRSFARKGSACRADGCARTWILELDDLLVRGRVAPGFPSGQAGLRRVVSDSLGCAPQWCWPQVLRQ